MARVIVFGSTGMVGRAVVARLAVLADLEALAVSRRAQGLDVSDPVPAPLGLLRGATLAVNCIGLLRSDPRYGTPAFQHAATLVNSLWPHRLATAASDTGCRVIHLSTDAVFSPGTKPAEESTPVSANEVYGISKAQGEVDAEHVINLRFSAVGPAPDRTPSLWEWLIRQPRGAVVPGHATFGWTGCTSTQLAWLVSDLVAPGTFEAVRSAGPALHFLPNGTTTKFTVLMMLANRLRPDVEVVATPQAAPTSRVLWSSVRAGADAYSGTHGWERAIEEVSSMKGPPSGEPRT